MTDLGVVEQEAYNARGQYVPDPRCGHPCQDLKNVHKQANEIKNNKMTLFSREEGGGGCSRT